MARQFKGLLFSGDGDFSGHESVALHKRLDEGLSILSGVQQEHPADWRKWKVDVEDIVKDIAAALLGRNIELTDELPYPPVDYGSKWNKFLYAMKKLPTDRKCWKHHARPATHIVNPDAAQHGWPICNECALYLMQGEERGLFCGMNILAIEKGKISFR